LTITFCELFCGIGGFRLGLEMANIGLEKARPKKTDLQYDGDFTDFGNTNWRASYPLDFNCVWANDNDKYACQIYRKHYGTKELVEGDIRTIDPATIPDFDLLTGYSWTCPDCGAKFIINHVDWPGNKTVEHRLEA